MVSIEDDGPGKDRGPPKILVEWPAMQLVSPLIDPLAFITCQNIAKDSLLRFLANANVNSRSCSLYAIARPSVVCLSSVTLVRPTQAVEIFRNISTAFGTVAIR